MKKRTNFFLAALFAVLCAFAFIGCSKPDPITYTVTFNSNGGDSVQSQTVESGGKATEPDPAPTKSDYVFAGWHKESSLTNKWLFATDTVTGNMTLYAKWTPVSENVYGEEVITTGANGSWNKDSIAGYVIVLGIDVSEFEGLMLNGEWVDSSNYEVRSGSTVIILKLAYMKKLTANDYTLTVVFENGTVETAIAITEEVCEACGKYPCECEGSFAWIFEDLDSIVKAFTSANFTFTVEQPGSDYVETFRLAGNSALFQMARYFVSAGGSAIHATTDQFELYTANGDTFFYYKWCPDDLNDLPVAYEITLDDFNDAIITYLSIGSVLFDSQYYSFDLESMTYVMNQTGIAGVLPLLGLVNAESATVTFEDEGIVFTASVPEGVFRVVLWDFGTTSLDWVELPDIRLDTVFFANPTVMTIGTQYLLNKDAAAFTFTPAVSGSYRMMFISAAGGSAYGQITIFNVDGYQINNFGAKNEYSPEWALNLTAGETYYIRAWGSGQRYDDKGQQYNDEIRLVIEQ